MTELSDQYVIYCRKSTDESSGQQTQSIPDQIKSCMEYAKANNLQIALKPDDFPFETQVDIAKEDAEADIYIRRIYQDTRKYYIIKEQKSAKLPWVRPKRKLLMSLIKKWKIKGLLSYAPDRQARNMLEGWEIIDCVDQGLVNLKYNNFQFENTPSGKMMLGIWLVFSKQYSDNLWSLIHRGKSTGVSRWKSQGNYKYWYTRDEITGYFKPHPEYFSLMKEAFRMKVYDNKSDEYIASRLNSHGFLRKTKKTSKEVNRKRLTEVWRDPFYYGIYISWNNRVNLLEIDTPFEPLISETEYNVLLYRYTGWDTTLHPKYIKDDNEELLPLPRWFLRATDGTALAFYITNKHRVNKRLKEAQKKDPNLTLKDIVGSHEIRFRNAHKESPTYWYDISFSTIEKTIIEMLNQTKIDDKGYNEYIEYVGKILDKLNLDNRTKINNLEFQIGNLTSQKKEYIKLYMWKLTREDEQEIYSNQLLSYDTKIKLLEEERNSISTNERDTIVELSTLVNFLKTIGHHYANVSYVQKRKITELLYSNIIVDKEKRLTFEVKPLLEHLFSKEISFFGDED